MSWDMYDMTQKVQVVMVAIVLPLIILAASLWHDWVEEGQSPRARKIMKDWEWNIDEMAHAVNVKGRLIGYRLLLRCCLLSSKPFAIWRAMRIKRKCGNRWDTVCSII